MLSQLPIPAIFAHRGSSRLAPENTIAAFNQALRTGCDGIELDVRLCASGEVVVCHDAKVDRTTNGRGWVSGMTLSQLKALDAGIWFDPLYKGERLPTLAECLQLVGEQAVINIELKATPASVVRLVRSVAAIVEDFQLTAKVIFSSFSASLLTLLNQYLPLSATALLTYPGPVGCWARVHTFSKGSYQSLHPYYKDVTPKMLGKYPRVHAYTVNHPFDMKRLFTWGIGGIITDEPELAMKIRSEVFA